MVTAFHVAHHIITQQHARGRAVDKLQLQKLLYLSQGIHLELWGTRIFTDEFRAYRNGPVVRSVEQEYRKAAKGSSPLPAPENLHEIPSEVAMSVDLVLDLFGDWNGQDLERFTKRPGTPWQQTRGDLPSYMPSSRVIEPDLVLRWFRQHGANPVKTPLTDAQMDAFDKLAAGDEQALNEIIQ